MSVIVRPLTTFKFHFPEAEWDDTYNCFEVYRSRVSLAGPYEEITAEQSAPASFLIPSYDSYDVNGETLTILVDRTVEVDITFTGTSAAQVTADINAAMPSAIKAEQVSGGIQVSSLSVGHNSVLDVTASDAWTNLHMSATYFFGQTSWPSLVSGTDSYTFVDQSALTTWYYKTRYRNKNTGAYSAFHLPFLAEVSVESDDLIVAETYVLLPTGAPARDVLVVFDVAYDASSPEVMPYQAQAYTDKNGYVSMNVVKGVTATVSIAGTNLARKIQVPSTGTSFDLLDPDIGVQPDAFAVQVPNIKVGERRDM